MTNAWRASDEGEDENMSQYKLVALTNPVEGREDEYNDWYNNRHVHDVVNVPGFVSAQRFKARSESTHRYLAIYEMECDDPIAAFATLGQLLGTDAMPLSEALDLATIQTAIFETITGKVVK
jgi:2-methylcitrate dehydratase PrpD